LSLYSDINSISPYSISELEDLDSVYQSIFTILETVRGELLFLPTFGASNNDNLFEVIDEINALLLFQDIINAINAWDSRVSLNLQKSNALANPDNNQYDITLYFSIQGFDNEFVLNKSI
jgi:phage baseplate assembly protein W